MIEPVEHPSDATWFTLLDAAAGIGPDTRAPVPRGPIDAEDLARLYAYEDDGDDPVVRLNFVTSIDGAVTVDGASGGLGGPGDRTVFALLRRLADVVLVGAGTVRAENYGGVRLSQHVQRARAAAGRPPVPPVAVVTAGARLDPAHRIFHDTAVAPLILVGPDAPAVRTRALRDVGAEVVALPGDHPAPGLARIPRILAERGHRRILCEGGPGLTGRLLRDGAVDELCLTTAPMLVGGRAARLTAGPDAAPAPAGPPLPPAPTTPMRRRHLLTDESGALYARWVVGRGAR